MLQSCLRLVVGVAKRYFEPKPNFYFCVFFYRSLSNGPQEVKIAVPWGHIAGKWWNKGKSEPILAIHGWVGNASSFDRLVPMLSDQLSILAIDLPGYGFSSHLAPGVYYHRLNSVVVVQRIVKHFKLDKVSLLGHNMGGSIAFLYSCAFPDTVKSLSIINAPMTPIPTDEAKYLDAAGLLIDKFLERDYFETSSKKKLFSKEDFEEIAASQFDFTLTKEALKALIERGGKCDSDATCYFTHDVRLHDNRLSGWNSEEILQLAEEVKTHVLIIMYDQSPYYMPKEDFFRFWEVIKKRALSAEMHIVQGSRHDLLDNPEGSSQILNKHFSKYHLARKD